MPVSHFKVRLIGSIAGGEVWSCSMGFASITNEPIFVDQVGLAEWAAAIRDAPLATTIPPALINLLSSSASLRRVRVEYYGDDGQLVDAGEAAWTAPVAGASSPNMPPQCAVTVTLNTDRPGRSYSGRFYWPSLYNNISGGSLRMSSETTTAISSAAAVMLSRFAALAPDLLFLNPVVVSNTKSETTRVRTVRVGDVIDTQRRRRDAYAENYSVTALQ